MRLLVPLLFTLWLAALAASDARRRLLPNALTLGGAALALAGRLAAGGLPAVADGAAGGLVCALLLLLPFALGAAGGGDVKMLFAVGCYFGSVASVGALLYISLCGLALAALWALSRRGARRRLAHLARSLLDPRYDRAAGRAALPPRESADSAVPFGIAIAAGAWLALVLPPGGPA